MRRAFRTGSGSGSLEPVLRDRAAAVRPHRPVPGDAGRLSARPFWGLARVVPLGRRLRKNRRSLRSLRSPENGSSAPTLTGTPIYFSLDLNRRRTNSWATFRETSLRGLYPAIASIFRPKTSKAAPRNVRPCCRTAPCQEPWYLLTRMIRCTPNMRQFTVKLIPQRRPGPPQRYDVAPTTFYREFSVTN